jgi:hypothetical protein
MAAVKILRSDPSWRRRVREERKKRKKTGEK